MQRKWQIAIFSLVHIVIFTVIFNYTVAPDVEMYFDYSSQILQGQLPYQDFEVVYPPLTLVFFLLPRFIAADLNAFVTVFAIEMLLFDLVGLLIISAMSRRLGIPLWSTLTIYTLAVLAVGSIIVQRYDLVPAIMVLLALYTFSQGRRKIPWALLAVGMMTKIYPAVLAPIFLIYQIRHRQKKRIFTGVAIFAVTTIAIIAPFYLLSPDGFWDSFGFHVQRGLQSESTYSSFLLLGHTWGLTTIQMNLSASSFDLVSPIADTLAKISPLVMLLSLGVVYWFFYRSQSGAEATKRALAPNGQPDMANIVKYSLLAILIFMVTSKVLSPQFIIWLYPLVPLIIGRWRLVSLLMFVAVGIMSYYIYPLHYGEFTQLKPALIYILFFRNVLLIALAGLLLVEKPTPVLSKL